jgi:mannose-6-phosphate isomerase
MTPLYPLVFRPLFKRYLWGGRRLGELLKKPIGPESDYAESWEIADHRHGQSVVANGPLAGTTLHELVTARGTELLGRHAPQPRFPLIFKFLDCQRDLSVQVHPNDAAAALQSPPDLGKTEAWVVLDALQGSRIYAGLKPGVDRAELETAVASGNVEACLHWFHPTPGDCVFIPAGALHALGAGLVVAEIQQASDTTYRLYDWNRVGPDGQLRALHIEESLAAIDYSADAITPQKPAPSESPVEERLVRCDKFIVDRLTFTRGVSVGGDDRFHIVSVLFGTVRVMSDPEMTISVGQTILLPACLGPLSLVVDYPAVVLDIYLPD